MSRTRIRLGQFGGYTDVVNSPDSSKKEPRLLDTPTFAASTLRAIAGRLSETPWGVDDWIEFLNRLADELDG